MRRTYIASALFAFLLSLNAMPQTTSGDSAKNYFGLNIGHTLAVKLISQSLSENTNYVPIHIQWNHYIANGFGISSSFIYRLDKDGHEFATNEFGVCVGPAYMQKGVNGFFIDCKIGLAVASGKDYYANDYSRTDLVFQPEMGSFVRLNEKLSMCFGVGIQSLVMLSEDPARQWRWNSMGKLSHYYLPVLNIGFGFTQ